MVLFLVKNFEEFKEQSVIISTDWNGLMFKEFRQHSGETHYCTEIIRNFFKNKKTKKKSIRTHLKAMVGV